MDVGAVAGQQNAQNRSNAFQQAAFNRINQTGPFGSVSYRQSGTDAQGNPIFEQTTALNPDELAYRDDVRGASFGGYQGGLGALNQQVGQARSTPYSAANYDGLQSFLPGSGRSYASNAPASLQGFLNNQQTPLQRVSSDPEGLLASGASRLGEYGANSMPTSQGAFDQAYRTATANIEPRMDRARDAMENKLRNQGLDPTSEAYKSQMNDLALQQNEARNNLTTQLQGQLFSQGMAGRQQGFNEAQGMYGLGSNRAGQLFGQDQTIAGLGENALNRGLQATNLAASLGENATNRQQQGELAGTQLAANLNEASQGRDLNAFGLNTQAASALGNLGRSGMIDPVIQPGVSGYNGVNVGNVDMGQLYGQQYQQQMNNYNAQMQQRNEMLGGLGAIGGTLLGIPMGGGLSLGGIGARNLFGIN